jgi:hypothetical protein
MALFQRNLSMKFIPVLALLVFSTPVLAHEHHAHVHGVAKLEVAVEGAEINLHLESPLEGVLGFEHAPGNDKERAVVAEMRKKMAQGAALFSPTSAAQCSFVSVKLEAPSLDARPAAGHNQQKEEHGDLDADFRFTCAQPAKLTGMEVRLFEAFPKLRRIDAQVVSGKGQKAVRLSSKMRFVSW